MFNSAYTVAIANGFNHINPMIEPIQVKNEEKIRCSSCGKEFASVKGRQGHERSGACLRLRNIDLNESLQGGVNCPDCGKNLANSSALTAHQLFCKAKPGAIDYKTFARMNPDKKCRMCGRIFSQISGLYAHSKFCKSGDMSKITAPEYMAKNNSDLDDFYTGEDIDHGMIYDDHTEINYSHKKFQHPETLKDEAAPKPPEKNEQSVVTIKAEPIESDIVRVVRPNSSPFMKVLPSLQHDDTNHDVTLVSSDRSLLTCHAAILAAASPYFAQLLNNPMADDDSVLIIAENVNSCNMRNVLDFLYMGKVRKSKQEVHDLKMILGEFKIKFNPEMLASNGDEVFSPDIADSSMDEVADFRMLVGHLDQSNGNIEDIDMYTEPLEAYNDQIDSDDDYVPKKSKNKEELVGLDYDDDEYVPKTKKFKVESDDDDDYIPKKKKYKKKNSDKNILSVKKRGRPKKGFEKSPNNDKVLEYKSSCDYCGVKTKTLKDTMKHIKEEHEDMLEEFEKIHLQTPCEYCEQKFLNTKSLYYHKKVQHPEALEEEAASKPLKPPKAGRPSLRNYPITDGLPYKADRMCPHCPRILKDIESFEDHVQAHIAGTDTPYSCDTCGRKFQRSANLRMHKKKHKISPTPLLCNLCGSIFQTEFEYKKHNRTHQNEKTRVRKPVDNKPVVSNFSCLCNLCGQNFTSKYKYKAHVNRAHIDPDELLTCPHCPQTFVNVGVLDRHITLHLPPTFQCDHCDKKFHTNYYLKTHVKRKHVADSEKDFVCSQCGKGFANKETLEGHLNMHAGLKPFKCRYCEMCYQNKSNRMAHEKRTHPDLHVKIRNNLGGVPVNKRQEVQMMIE